MNYKVLICLSAVLSVFIFASNAYAVTFDSSADTKYLYNCGYSKELLRVVENEKKETQGEPVKGRNQVFKFIKGLFYETDFTEHNQDFGLRRIRSY